MKSQPLKQAIKSKMNDMAAKKREELSAAKERELQRECDAIAVMVDPHMYRRKWGAPWGGLEE